MCVVQTLYNTPYVILGFILAIMNGIARLRRKMNFSQNGKRGVAVWHMISLLSGSGISLGPQIICQTAKPGYYQHVFQNYRCTECTGNNWETTLSLEVRHSFVMCGRSTSGMS